jgi:hypothetical protein
MRPTQGTAGQPVAQTTQARTLAQQERTDHRDRAVRTVAAHAHDREDFVRLLSVLGLDDPDGGLWALTRSLAAYVNQVAVAIGVPRDSVAYEVSDTATAYLGLGRRSPAHAGRDLMVVWDEQLGWQVAVETHPDETPLVLSYLRGDIVPPPAVVARFVTTTVDGGHVDRLQAVQPPLDRIAMARKMSDARTGRA